MSNCPDETDLAAFLNDALGAERLAAVSGHVDGCRLCQARLDRLTEQTSGAAARYKELSSVSLPDALSGGAVAPDDATQIGGARPALPVFGGPPQVPGFEVLGPIGRGGMGVVFKARHRRLNRLVALKMILAGASDPRAVQRFLFEGEVLARVQHPQVVTVFGVDTYDGPTGVPVPYLAMELLEGGSLADRLREVGTGAAPRPAPRAAAELVEGLARAVHVAHLQGIVHRDLKPTNILFGKDEAKTGTDTGSGSSFLLSPSFLPKVTDFGLAKFTQGSGAELTHTGQIVGTPHYMAPEQAAGAKRIGPAADVYALGAILFECLAGRVPFTGAEPLSVLLKVVNEPPPDVRAARPDVPRALAAVVTKCLAKDPERRYASAEALAADLRRFLDGRSTEARPVTAVERLWFAARRNPAVAGLLGALALVLCAGFVVVAGLWARAEQRAESEKQLKLVAEDAIDRATSREGELEFSRAVQWCADGRVGDGLDRFVRALELAEQTGDAPRARAARLNIAAWARELPAEPQRFRDTERPRLAAFHPDGKHLVIAGQGLKLYLWDVAARKRVRTYHPKFDPTDRTDLVRKFAPLPLTNWAVAVSPDGRLLASGGTDGRVTTWDTSLDRPGAEVPPLAAFDLGAFGEVNVWTLTFTADRVLWSNDGANGLRRWDLTDPRKPTSERFPVTGAGAVRIMTRSPDGRRLYTGDSAGQVREWDAATGAQRRSWAIKGGVADVAVSPDGARLAAIAPEGRARVFDLTSGQQVLEIGLAGAVGHGVAFAPKRPYLVTSDGDGNVRFWHRDTGQPIGQPRPFPGAVGRVRFRPDADEFAVPAGDSVYLCPVPDPPGNLISAGHGVRVTGLDFAPTGDRLAVSDERTFGVFDPRTGTPVPLGFAPTGGAQAVRFDPSGRRVFLCRGNGFDWFAVPDGKAIERAGPKDQGRALRLEFARAGIVVLGPRAVSRFDAGSFERVAIEPPSANFPWGVELSALAVRPDGAEVFAVFGDRAAVLNGDTLEPLREWAIGDEVLDARYTPDGGRILIGGRAGAAERLDAATGARVGPPMPHGGAVTSVAVAPNGEVLFSGSRDGTARFWDAATGLPIGPPLRHAGPVAHVAYAPDGTRVATGTSTGHVMLWAGPPAPVEGTVADLRARFGKNG